MTVELTLLLRVQLEPGDETGEEFADYLQYQFSEVIEDIEVLDIEEV